MFENMTITRAVLSDASEILALQKLAYQSEAAIWNDYTIPPLTQTLASMEVDFAKQIILKAVAENRIIGSVRAYLQDGTCYIGRVTVHPDLQNRGLGKLLMHAIEREFGQAQRYELFTGTKSERNLYFYQKLGYRIFKQAPLSDTVELVYLEKPGPAAQEAQDAQ
jgi:ribosomal protein S18 acetylase RimI-like enzyme